MNNKTCGECKHFYTSDEGHCSLKGDWGFSDDDACKDFCLPIDRLPAGVITAPKPTNGDRIRQGGNKRLIIFSEEWSCFHCAYFNGIERKCEMPEGKGCLDGIEEWLNAPAESEGEDDTARD